MRKFTLIELLIVMLIILTLVAILLPALSKARERGKVINCVSNLKQIGTAEQMYANDNIDFIAVPYWPNYGTVERGDIYSREANNRQCVPNLLISGAYTGTNVINGTVTSKDAKAIFCCPGDTTIFDTRSFSEYYLISYPFYTYSKAQAANEAGVPGGVVDSQGNGVARQRIGRDNSGAVIFHDYTSGLATLRGSGFNSCHESTVNALYLGGYVKSYFCTQKEQAGSWGVIVKKFDEVN